jgi:hypothetical protein
MGCRSVFIRNGLISLALLLALLPSWVNAVMVNDLYIATVRVADRSEAARNAAMTDALGVVLTKISGRREGGTRVAAATINASRYVQRVGYVAGGQLEIGFDNTAINAMLEQSGLPLWDRERPVTLVVYPTTLQGRREARAATELAAKNRGLPVVWALAESSEQFPVNNLGQIQALAQRYQAEAVLLARSTQDDPSLTNLRWQLVFRGTTHESHGDMGEGPYLAAEQISRYYGASGKESTRLVMEVSGVSSIEAYAKTLDYLQSLLMVRNLSVQSLQGDVIRLQLELRGNQQALQRVLAIEQRLSIQASSMADASATMSYRFTH